MNNWNLIVIVGCTLLGFVLVRQEFVRPVKHWRWVRCFVTVCTMLALGGMVYQFKKPASGNVAEPEKKTDSANSKKISGFPDIHWTTSLRSGQPLMVGGRYRNSNPFAVTLVLSGFDSPLDSVKIPPRSEQPFQLQTIPKQKGKALFQLAVKADKNILETEPIPMVVESGEPLNILMLSAYPDFENKFLSQWLTSNHMQVVQRTRISQNRYEKIFLNSQPFEFNRITDELLSGFDLIICDVTALAVLSAGEQSAIRHQVARNGLGLMIRADTIPDKKSFYDIPFSCYPFTVKNNPARLLFTSDSLRPLPYADQSGGIGIRYQYGTQPLIFEKSGAIRVSSFLEGSGKICFSTINNSYVWSLGGKEQVYGYYWTYLIQKTAKQKKASLRIWASETFPRVDEPVNFTIESRDGNPPAVAVGKDSLYLLQRKSFSVYREGLYWPGQSGWQPAVHAGNVYFEWYVFDRKDWPLFLITQMVLQTASPHKEGTGRVLLFFLFFMSGWCFLWLERKFFLI